MKMKQIHKILLAVGSLGCIICYFFPFFKVGIDSFFSFDSTAISGFEIILSFLTHSREIAAIEELAGSTTGSTAIVIIVFFMIPLVLALANIVLALVLKPKIGGIILTVTNFIGFAINLIMRLLLAMPADGFLIDSYDDIVLYQPAAYAIMALFFLCMGGSIALIILSKDSKAATANSFEGVNLQDNVTTVTENAFGYQDNGSQDNGGFQNNEFQNNGAQNSRTYQPEYQAASFPPAAPSPAVQSNPTVAVFPSDTPSPAVAAPKPAAFPPNAGSPFAAGASDDNVTVKLDQRAADSPVGAPAKKKGSIVCVDGMYKSAVFPIEEGEEIFIGRDKAKCNIILDPKLTYVGRNHCSLIYLRDGSYLIKVYSSNGVIINNKGLLKESARVKLPKGTVITLGKRDITFELK